MNLFSRMSYTSPLTRKLLPLILGHNPAGTSSRTLVHYAQEIRSKKFRQYDYGIKNYIIYNSPTPPEYNISLIRAPIALLYATNDLLATPKDVQQLYQSFHEQVEMIKVNYTKFNHLDFLWGRSATNLVYETVFRLLGSSLTSKSISTSVIPESFITYFTAYYFYYVITKTFGSNILLEEKTENPEKKAEAKPAPPIKEDAKAATAKKIEEGKNKVQGLLADITKKLPAWQKSIVNKLSAIQQLVAKKIGTKGK